MAIFKCVSLIGILVSINCADATQLTIGRGSPIILRLPGSECGKYTLLNGLLKPVLVMEKNVPKLLGEYRERANITESASGYNLTIHDAGLQDDGKYKVASSRDECKDIEYYVTVRALTQEFLEQWGGWSKCTTDCSESESRSRTRNCSINGGCLNMGDMSETQTCNQADHCAQWSTWGSFGECSAKCGKGFKIRSRNCLKGNSILLQSDACPGPAIQSHMCMVMCEVVGVWTGWSEWTECAPDCGVGQARNRTRLCNDPRATPNCPGNYTEHEDCESIVCTVSRNETANETYSTSPVNEAEVTSQAWLSELNLVVVLVIVGAITLIVLIVVFMLVRRRLQVKRVNSSRLTRDTQVENATIDKRLTQANKRPSRPDGVNVYSELGSSFCYNDSEFEDSEDGDDNGGVDDNNTPEVDNDTNMSKEAGVTGTDPSQSEPTLTDTNNGIVRESTSQLAQVNIYDNNTRDVNMKSLLRNLSDMSIYSDPPEEEDPDDEINPDDVFVETGQCELDKTECNGGSLLNEITDVFAVSPGSGSKSLDGMYRKVNKTRGKPNRVEINHSNDVYYDPPVYSESAEPEMDVEKDSEPEVDFDDNVYENCDVKDGKTEIIQKKSGSVSSEIKTNDDGDEVKLRKGKTDADEKTAIDLDIHPKMKEALEDAVPYHPAPGPGEEEEHLYMNDEIRADLQDYYVTPRYSQQHKHIYDVPRSPV